REATCGDFFCRLAVAVAEWTARRWAKAGGLSGLWPLPAFLACSASTSVIHLFNRLRHDLSRLRVGPRFSIDSLRIRSMTSLTRYRRNMVNARISKIQPTVFRRLLMLGIVTRFNSVGQVGSEHSGPG